MDRINDAVDSKFRFVLLAAQRAEQMMSGAHPKLANPEGLTKARIAMLEILEGKVDWDYGPAPSPAPAPAAVVAEAVAEESAVEGDSPSDNGEGVN